MLSRIPIYPVALSAAFVALQIAGEINWAWYWLVSPMLIAIAIAMVVALFTGATKK